ncbi:zinc finger, SWIM-type containing protein [Tanacetum coccineum]
MTTSSTSSLLLVVNTPTTNLPPAMTTKLPLATFTTTNLPPATSTTSHLPPATSSTKNLLIEAEIEEIDDVNMNEDVEANVILEPVKINTPRPSLYLHNETPGGTTYWEPNVDEPYLPLEGKRFDTIEECVEFYSVYAEKGGFEVKKSAQKKTRHFLRYGFLCRHVFCVLKNCNIEVIPERYILRRWRRDLIPPALRRNTNRYGEKDEAIEKLTNEANFMVDECLFLLRKDKEQLKHFVEKLENIKKEIQASNKGGRRGERRKSGREIAMKAKAKRARKCGYSAAEQERRTAASASEQEERNSDTIHIADKEQSNTAS